MDSKTGINKLLETYKSGKADAVFRALSHGNGEYLTDEFLKVVQVDYEAVKKRGVTLEEIKRLDGDLVILQNKYTDNAVELLKTMLSEKYLLKADNLLRKSRGNLHNDKGLKDRALETLYYSGKDNDFIWQMFLATRTGLLGGILNKDAPRMLNTYAFRIGSKILDPDEFYNMFFETDLYKDVVKNERSEFHYSHAFQDCFLADNSPAFSKKIVYYFAESMGDCFHMLLACDLLEPDYSDILDTLVKNIKTVLRRNLFDQDIYSVLKKIAESGHDDFAELYESYNELHRKMRGYRLPETDYLAQFLNKK